MKVFYDEMTIAELEEEVAVLSAEIDELRELSKSFEAAAKVSSLPFLVPMDLMACIQKRDAVLDIIEERQKPEQLYLWGG